MCREILTLMEWKTCRLNVIKNKVQLMQPYGKGKSFKFNDIYLPMIKIDEVTQKNVRIAKNISHLPCIVFFFGIFIADRDKSCQTNIMTTRMILLLGR